MEKIYERIEYSNENFRKNINYLIQRDNITKAALDNVFGIGEGSMSRYCKTDENAIEPRIGIINSLAKYFGVTIDDLINNDIEKKEIKEQEYSQRKEVLFCNKLIKETKENILDWHELNFYDDGFIQHQYYEDTVISDFLEGNGKFKSKFTYKEYDLDELIAFTVMINERLQLVLIELFSTEDEVFSPRYELYLIKPGCKVLASCASHKSDLYDDIYFNLLKELYKASSNYVYIGKDAYEKELIYDDYLELLPF
jgi:transcriptional regulator with XRE-family HTH domain